MKNPYVIFVMGVSGCGKSSVGESISSIKSMFYLDADDVHPKANVDKMAQGVPLTDSDRFPWLERLNGMATKQINDGNSMVVACSCLTPLYRQMLQNGIESYVHFVYLEGTFDVIKERMQHRQGHYFKGDDMLKSQFKNLIAPTESEAISFVQVSIESGSPDDIARIALEKLSQRLKV